MILRPYQRESLDALYAYWANDGGNALIVVPTGGGKSLIIAMMMRELLANYPDLRIAIVTHVRELILQDYQELVRAWPGAPAGVYSAGLGRRDARAQILFAGVQSVWNKHDALGPVDLLLIDECFASGTQVETVIGPRPIQDIRPGDVVRNATGFGKVRAVSSRSSRKLVTLRLNDGTTINCTENHPLFTSQGWVEAGNLARGTRLFSQEDVRELRRNIPSVDEGGRSTDAARSMGKTAFLLNLLLEGERERNVGSRRDRAHDEYASQDRPSSEGPFRQRTWDDEATTGRPDLAGRRMDCGTLDRNWGVSGDGPSEELQAGYRSSGNENSDRIGRGLALRKETNRGSSEGQFSNQRWVESVSRQKQGCGQVVFNLDVSGHPSYYAGGVLVHNCHLVPRDADTRYRKLIDGLRARTPDMRVCGLTATPFRTSTGRLDLGDERIFDDIVYEARVADLIRDGYLSPLISKATATRFDLTGVARRGGEYVPAALERVVDKDDVTASAVAEMVTLGADRRAWLAFCTGVDHATHVRDAIRTHGITAEVVTGETPTGERDRIIRDFKAGRIRCLTSISVLFTGFNVPQVDLVALMRPTCSAGVFIQSVGRGFRLAPGKVDCLVLDYAGLVKKFGPIDTIEVTHGYIKPSDDEKEVRAKECPDCKALLALNTRVCPYCDHAFGDPPEEQGPKHDATADSTRSILSTAPPAWIAVSNWRFYRHEKAGRTPTLRVEYSCGLAVHRKWVCIEHPPGGAREKAKSWWTRHGGAFPIPTTVDEARSRSRELTMPDEILVKPDGKYFTITNARVREKEAA